MSDTTWRLILLTWIAGLHAHVADGWVAVGLVAVVTMLLAAAVWSFLSDRTAGTLHQINFGDRIKVEGCIAPVTAFHLSRSIGQGNQIVVEAEQLANLRSSKREGGS